MMKTSLAALLAATLCFPSSASASDAIPVTPLLLSQFDAKMQPQAEEGQDGFSFRRFRLGLWSNPTKWAFVIGSVEFSAPERPQVVNGFVTIVPAKMLRLTAGFSRNPLFVTARSERDGMRSLPELAMPTRALFPGRDLGLEAHFIPDSLPMEAWFRVSNGVNGSIGKTVTDSPTLAYSGRLDATFGRASFRPNVEDTFGARVGVGAFYNQTTDRAGIEGRTEGDYVFYQPPTVSGARTIVEGHALVYAGPVRAVVEVGAALENRSVNASGAAGAERRALDPVQTRGGSLEVAWMITGQHRIAGAWPIHTGDRLFAYDHLGVEVAARVERLDLARQTRDLTAGGATGGVLGVTCWLSDAMSVALAGHAYAYDVAPIDEPNRTSSWLLLSRLTVYLNPPPVAFAQTPMDQKHRAR